MKIENFKVEEWFNEYESKAKYDLADTCIDSISLKELLNLAEIDDIGEILDKKEHKQDDAGKVISAKGDR